MDPDHLVRVKSGYQEPERVGVGPVEAEQDSEEDGRRGFAVPGSASICEG